MHTTGRAATKRLNLAEMEDLVRLAHTAHTLTLDLITDTVVDHVGALVRELAHHRLLEIGMHNPPTCPECSAIARTTADDALAGFRRDERSLSIRPRMRGLVAALRIHYYRPPPHHLCLVQFKIARDGPP